MRSIVLFLLCIHSINIACGRRVYVGSINNGVWIYDQNSDGTLTVLSNPVKSASGFIAIHPNGKNLYTTGANDRYVAYQLDDLNLIRLNDIPAHDGQKCDAAHVSVHSDGKTIFGANYGDGSFVAFGLNDDGSLRERTSLNSPGKASWGVPSRQEAPHAHMITATPNPKFVVGMDLGADRIWTWTYNGGVLTVASDQPDSFVTPTGSGPRHIAFSPDGKYAYVINELACTVLVLSFNLTTGVFTRVQSLSSLSPGAAGGSLAAEVRVHPTGRFVYVSNRWNSNNNIGVFSVDTASGALQPVAWVPSGATSPRGMNLCPSGRFLYAAHEYGDSKGKSLFAFSIDQATGGLTPIGSYANGGSCSDVEFAPEASAPPVVVNPGPVPMPQPAVKTAPRTSSTTSASTSTTTSPTSSTTSSTPTSSTTSSSTRSTLKSSASTTSSTTSPISAPGAYTVTVINGLFGPIEINGSRPGTDLARMPVTASDAQGCQTLCHATAGCRSWSFNTCDQGRNCWLKSGTPDLIFRGCRASGIVNKSNSRRRM